MLINNIFIIGKVLFYPLLFIALILFIIALIKYIKK